MKVVLSRNKIASLKSVLAVAELEMQKRAVGEYEKRYFYQQYVEKFIKEFNTGVLTVGEFVNPPEGRPHIMFVRNMLIDQKKIDFSILRRELLMYCSHIGYSPMESPMNPMEVSLKDAVKGGSLDALEKKRFGLIINDLSKQQTEQQSEQKQSEEKIIADQRQQKKLEYFQKLQKQYQSLPEDTRKSAEQFAADVKSGALTVRDFLYPPTNKPYIGFIKRQLRAISSSPSAVIKNDFNKLQEEIKPGDLDKALIAMYLTRNPTDEFRKLGMRIHLLVEYAEFVKSHPYVGEDLSQSNPEYHI